ncbi:MAG: glycosyltransferase family 2 protein [Methylosarcina sp.]|jgi:GT2 family glycosyltransferase
MKTDLILSAIIVNYNAGHLLRECVDSLLNCPLEIEIIVVDNASIDQSLNSIEDLSSVQIIRNSVNTGFATACNIGITHASADYLLFLNPDCSFTRGTLIELLKHLKSNKNIGMVGGLLVNPDGTEQTGGRRAVPTPWRSFVRAFGLSHFAPRWPKLFFDFDLHKQPLPTGPIEVEAISGACMLVKQQAIKDVGLWDEGYFLHCEDLDWCMRFRQKGWKILFIPSAKITHASGACGRSRPIFVEWHKHKGMMRFYQKFFRHQYPGILMFLVILGVWFRFTLIMAQYLLKRMVSRSGWVRG